MRGRVSIEAGPESGRQSQAGEPSLQSPSLEQTSYLQHFSKRAMACDFEVFFNLNQHEQSGNATANAFELIDRLESQLSIYREDSEVSRMNREAGEGPFLVSPVVQELLQRSLELYRSTKGAFDITSTPLSEAWGFTQRAPKRPAEEELAAALQSVGSEQISLSNGEVQFGLPGLSVNFNSIGKGYAVDRAVETLLEEWVYDFVIHGGQSSVAARGSSSVKADHDLTLTKSQLEDSNVQTDEAKTVEGSQEEEAPEVLESGWTVGLSHPFVPNRRLAEITLRDQSLSTSGTARQGFFHKGRRYGHVIDPRTGWPTDHFLSATVICDSTAMSDALATAFFVMSLEEVEAFCDRHSEVAAILIVPKSKSGGVTIETFNLPPNTMSIDWT